MDAIKRIKFYFICCLVTLNGLFIGYAFGLNSRHVLVVDPKLPKYVKPEAKHDASSKADMAGVQVPAAAKDKNGVKGKDGTNNNEAKDKGGAKDKGEGSRKGDAKDKSDAKNKGAHSKSDSHHSAKKVEAQSTSKNKDTSSKQPGTKQNSDHASP